VCVCVSVCECVCVRTVCVHVCNVRARLRACVFVSAGGQEPVRMSGTLGTRTVSAKEDY